MKLGSHSMPARLAAAAALILVSGAAQARELFVTNEKGNSVTIIDGDTLKVTATVPVGNRPRGIVISPDGKFLYICVSDDDTIKRSEERRVGKECRCRWATDQYRKKKERDM